MIPETCLSQIITSWLTENNELVSTEIRNKASMAVIAAILNIFLEERASEMMW